MGTFKSEVKLYLILILWMLLQSCSAVSIQPAVQVLGNPNAAITVETLGLAETLSGIQSAARGDTMTIVMSGPNQVMLAWRYSQGWGMVFMNTDGKPILDELEQMGWNGAGMQYSDLKDIIKILSEKGWTIIPATWLPTAVITTIKSYSITMLQSGADILPTIWVIPVINGQPMFDPLNLQGVGS